MKKILLFVAWLFGFAHAIGPTRTASNPIYSPSWSTRLKNKRLRLAH